MFMVNSVIEKYNILVVNSLIDQYIFMVSLLITNTACSLSVYLMDQYKSHADGQFTYWTIQYDHG